MAVVRTRAGRNWFFWQAIKTLGCFSLDFGTDQTYNGEHDEKKGHKRMIMNFIKKYFILLLIGAYALPIVLCPLIHYWFPPEGKVFTGFMTGDDSWHLSMMMQYEGWEGYTSWHWFLFTNSLIYRAIGLLGNVCSMTAVHYIAAMLFAILFLRSVFRFLETIIPGLAKKTFVLFLLSSGFGGLIYLLFSSGISFDQPPGHPYRGMIKVITYDMFEGSGITPYTQISRIYYTLGLALGFYALTHTLLWIRKQRPAYWALIFTFLACTAHIRFGSLLALISALAILVFSDELFTNKLKKIFLVGGAAILGVLPSLIFSVVKGAEMSSIVKYNMLRAEPLPLVISLGLLFPFVLVATLTHIRKSKNRWASAILTGLSIYNLIVLPLTHFRNSLSNLFQTHFSNSIPMDETRMAKLSTIVGSVLAIVVAGCVFRWKNKATTIVPKTADNNIESDKWFAAKDRIFLFLGIWFYASLLVCYSILPVTLIDFIQVGRLMNFLWLPGMIIVVGYIAEFNRVRQNMIVGLFILLSLPSIVFFHSWYFHGNEALIDAKMQKVVEYLDNHRGERVVCDKFVGSYLHTQSQNKEIAFQIGCEQQKHGAELQKLHNAIYSDQTNDELRKRYLAELKIKYLLVSEYERAVYSNIFNADKCSYLHPVLQKDGITLYRVDQ